MYRGIPVKTKEFVFGYYNKIDVIDDKKHFILEPKQFQVLNAEKAYNAISFLDWLTEIKQEPDISLYTKDKKGKEIFKNDVIEFEGKPYLASERFDISIPLFSPKEHQGTLIQNNSFFEKVMTSKMYAKSEIIGNIYSNPEFLEIRNKYL